MTKIKCRLCLKEKKASNEWFCKSCVEIGYRETRQEARKEFAEELKEKQCIGSFNCDGHICDYCKEIDKTLKEIEKS